METALARLYVHLFVHFTLLFSASTDSHAGTRQVYLKNLGTNSVSLVSKNTSMVSVNGLIPANGDSVTPTVNSDGRFVAFSTKATDILPGSTGVLVLDRKLNKWSSMASVNFPVTRFPVLDKSLQYSTGQSLAYVGVTNGGETQIEVSKLTPTGLIRLVASSKTGQFDTRSDNFLAEIVGSIRPGGLSIGKNGDRVLFQSAATNLVSGVTQPTLLKYLFDATGLAVPSQNNQMINVLPMHSSMLGGSTTENHAVMSGDGSVAIFYSLGNIQNLNPNSLPTIYRTKLSTGQTDVVTQSVSLSTPFGISVSYDGSSVAYATEVAYQIYIWRSYATSLIRLSNVFPNGSACASHGFGMFPVISGDGKTVTFRTNCPALVVNQNPQGGYEIVQINLGNLRLRQVSQQIVNGAPVASNGFNHSYDVSFDGEVVVFDSEATNILPASNQNTGSK